jgi:hypothetical protein
MRLIFFQHYYINFNMTVENSLGNNAQVLSTIEGPTQKN